MKIRSFEQELLMKRTKKRFVIGTAFAVGAAATLTGCCVPYLKPQPQPSVYGPPEYLEEPSEAFVPEEEVQEDVYGPPEYFDEGR